ncbi:MAG: amidohydrolase [Planctomycetes bacterium]|nr:amidohydrolase [Planctomycetota bacterium]
MRRLTLRLVALTVLTSPALAQPAIDGWLEAARPGLLELYRELHQNPELTFREVETAKRMAARFEAAGLTVVRNVGGLGVVGLLENGDGPTVMLRADMDALPVGERTSLPYASKLRRVFADGRVEGVMHACGHDMHMTVLVGTIDYLAQHRDEWRGTLLAIGQPAEERGAGARAMLEDGLFERFPLPDFALALHVSPDLPTGTVGYRSGPMMANVDSVDITVFGRGSHGAAPHLGIDPIVQASQLVLELQTIVSREIDPIEPAVVTVGAIHGGTKHNIISDRCDLQLTVRTLTDATRQKIHDAIRRKANAIASAAGAREPLVSFSEGTPALANDAELTERVVRTLRATFDPARVVEVPQAMVGEDFAQYGRHGVPICMLRLGTTSPERLARYAAEGTAPPGLHSAGYYPDPDDSLRAGIVALGSAALDLFGR